MEFHMGRYLEIFRGLHWESHLKNMVDMRVDPTLASQMGWDIVNFTS